MNAYNRKMPSVNFRAAVYMLVIPIITFYVLVMVGCISSSPGISSIFLIQLKQHADSDFAVRVGYFGTCAGPVTQLICIPTRSQSTSQVITQMSDNIDSARAQTLSSATSAGLFDVGLGFQNTTMYLVIVLGGICYFFGVICLFAFKLRTKSHAVRKPTVERANFILQRLTMGFLWGSTGLVFAAAVSTSQLAATLQSWPTKSVVLQMGSCLAVIQWLTLSFMLLFSAGVWRVLQDRSPRSTEKSNANAGGGLGWM